MPGLIKSEIVAVEIEPNDEDDDVQTEVVKRNKNVTTTKARNPSEMRCKNDTGLSEHIKSRTVTEDSCMGKTTIYKDSQSRSKQFGIKSDGLNELNYELVERDGKTNVEALTNSIKITENKCDKELDENQGPMLNGTEIRVQAQVHSSADKDERDKSLNDSNCKI